MEQRITTAGPHRDDLVVTLSHAGGPVRDVRTQASQGEQRSVTLALRMAAYDLLESQRGEPPILLLDDVLSELDPLRARGVLDLLPRGQVFLTTAREDEEIADGVRWKVRPGAIVR